MRYGILLNEIAMPSFDPSTVTTSVIRRLSSLANIRRLILSRVSTSS